MRKISAFCLFLSFVFFSCSEVSEDNELPIFTENVSILKFKDYEELIETYEELSNFNSSDDFTFWFNQKGFSNSYLEALYSKELDTTNFDVNIDKRELYSEALKAILNKDMELIVGNSKIKLINDQFILNHQNMENGDFRDKNESIGYVNNELIEENAISLKEDSNISERTYNNNTSHTITYNFNSGPGRTNCSGGSSGSSRNRRFLNTIFSETISINGVSTNRLYFRSTLQSEFCSFWRCKWENTPGEYRRITFTNFIVSGNNIFFTDVLVLGPISSLPALNFSVCVNGTYTTNIGTGFFNGRQYNIKLPANVFFSGFIKSEHLPGTGSFFPTWNQNANQFN